MNDTIREAVALAQTELLKRKLVFRLDLSAALPSLLGDQIQWEQVILNLILNGSEAMASTDGSGELLVTSQQSDADWILVTVRDSGVAINPQDMGRIFEAFFTTKPKGMGMGLAISRSIIEAHHGRIRAEANDGPGVAVQFNPGVMIFEFRSDEREDWFQSSDSLSVAIGNPAWQERFPDGRSVLR